MLGGIICPRVPDAEMTPNVKSSLYPLRNMTGIEMSPIAVTDAPTTPVAAASRAPTPITPNASPPLKRPNKMPMVSNRSSANLDFSNTVPMKMKNGIARSV